MWWQGEICLSPFVDNQTNTTWTLPLPPFLCPPPFGHGTFSPSRYNPCKHSSLFFFIADPLNTSRTPSTCPGNLPPMKLCKCIAIQGLGLFIDFFFSHASLLSYVCFLPLPHLPASGEFPLICFYSHWLTSLPPFPSLLCTAGWCCPLVYKGECLSTGGLYGWVVCLSTAWVSGPSVCLIVVLLCMYQWISFYFHSIWHFWWI